MSQQPVLIVGVLAAARLKLRVLAVIAVALVAAYPVVFALLNLELDAALSFAIVPVGCAAWIFRARAALVAAGLELLAITVVLDLRGIDGPGALIVPGLLPAILLLAVVALSIGHLRDLRDHLTQPEAWVIREALLQAGVWRRDGLRVGVSVNITPSLLRDESFLRLFERTLKIQGAPTSFIFEVAAASLGGTDRPIEGLTRLRERGVRLALDDVTDLAGLEAASWFRWEYVKLGRGLVTDAARDAAAATTVRAIVARAIELGARVQRVGVEDDDAIAQLRDAGVYSAQGYAIAPPLGVKELAAWSEGRRRVV